MRFGLLGRKLGHSYSPQIHSLLGDYEYPLYEKEPDEIADFMASGEFDGTGDYAWLEDNAWKYGFIKRYKGYKEELTGIAEEPWHFRYVGVPHAYLMDKYDLCLEEYLILFTQRLYTYDGNHLTADCLGKSYEMYYCEGTDIYVPTGSSYTVSGNGTGGRRG